MNYLACIGLLVLFGLCPQAAMSQGVPPSHRANTAILQADPEQLFVEAMKLAESGDRVPVNKPLDEACLLWTKRGDPERAAWARQQIGDWYRSDKRFDEALRQYQQTLLIQGLSPRMKALSYDSIGQVYAELYQTELSQRNYLRAFSLARVNKHYEIEAQVQLHLAVLKFKNGDFREAMKLAQNAAIASDKAKDQQELALALGLLAQMKVKNGRVEEGRNDLDRALTLYRQDNDVPAQIKALCFLSSVNLAAAQVSLAKEQAESALKLAVDLARSATTDSQKLRANALRWPCYLALARAQRAAQQPQDALKSYFRAAAGTVIDWWKIYASTERSAIGFAEERQALYRELVDLLVELGQIDEAYDAYQYARIRTLSGFMLAPRLAGVRADTDIDNKINALSASIITLRTKLLSPTLNKSQRETLQQELAEVEDDLAEKRLQAELNHPKRRLVFSTPAKLKQLQTQVLRDGEAVLEFCFGEERSFAWLISRENVSFEILPGRGSIEERVRQYLNELSVAPSNLHLQSRIAKQQALAEELFTTLFGKLARQLHGNSKLIVIPDGLLNYVPYESLVHNGRYVIEDHEISYLPSASLIELLRQRSTSDQSEQLDLLAFGDPLFPQRSKPSATRTLLATPAKNDREAFDWDMSNISRLPRTRDEVEYIASLIPKERKRLYLGKESTEKTFKQEPLNKYRWIHFATHSWIDERNPGRSAVVLALDGNHEEDGFLRATEIADLNLNSDLVSLSACETGRGRLSSGEGIIGLSRSFFIAGARSVVVSQWAVSDISTAQLMKDFYQQLVNGTAKPAALREAKLRMFRGGSETRHPYYWAPFIIIGAP